MDDPTTEESPLLSSGKRVRTISEGSNLSVMKNSFLCQNFCPNFLSDLSGKEKLIIFILCFITFFESSCFSVMAPFFPAEAAVKGVSTTVIGVLFGVFELIIFFASPIFGMHLTKLGINFTYLSGLLVSGCCSILFGFLKWCPNGPIFIVMCFATRGIEAIAASAYLTSSMAIVTNTVPSHLSLAIGFIETFNGLGMMAGPPIGGLLYKIGGFSLPFWTLGGILFFFGIISFKFLPNMDENVSNFSGSRLALLKHPYILALCFCMITGASSIAFLDPSLAPELERFNLTPEYIGLIFLIYPAIYAITAPFWGWISDAKATGKMMGSFYCSRNYLTPDVILYLYKSQIRHKMKYFCHICGALSLALTGYKSADKMYPTPRLVTSQIWPLLSLVGHLVPTAEMVAVLMKTKHPNLMIIGGCFLYSTSYVFLGPVPFLNLPSKLWGISLSLGFSGLFIGCMLIPVFSAIMQSALQLGLPEDINTFGLISGLLNSCFSFGAFLGPAAGSAIKEKIGFAWTCFVIAIFMCTSGIVLVIYRVVNFYNHPKTLSVASTESSDTSTTQNDKENV